MGLVGAGLYRCDIDIILLHSVRWISLRSIRNDQVVALGIELSATTLSGSPGQPVLDYRFQFVDLYCLFVSIHWLPAVGCQRLDRGSRAHSLADNRQRLAGSCYV